MLGEDAAVVVFFFVQRRVDGEPLGGMCHLLVGDLTGGDFLQRVYPRIAHSVGELFLLPPCHRLGKHVLESLAHNAFFDGFSGTHLQLWVQSHGNIQELFVEERHAPLNTPRRQTLVGAQTVVHVQFAKFANGLVVEFLGIGRLVEI